MQALGKQYRHLGMKQRAQMMEAAVSRPIVVPLPWKADEPDEYTSGLYAMRHMERYMCAPTKQWED